MHSYHSIFLFEFICNICCCCFFVAVLFNVPDYFRNASSDIVPSQVIFHNVHFIISLRWFETSVCNFRDAEMQMGCNKPTKSIKDKYACCSQINMSVFHLNHRNAWFSLKWFIIDERKNKRNKLTGRILNAEHQTIARKLGP